MKINALNDDDQPIKMRPPSVSPFCPASLQGDEKENLMGAYVSERVSQQTWARAHGSMVWPPMLVSLM